MLRLIRKFMLWVVRETRETRNYAISWHEDAVMYHERWKAYGNPSDRVQAISNALRACKTMLRAQFGSIDDVIFYVVEHKLVKDDTAAALQTLEIIRNRLLANPNARVPPEDVATAIELSNRIVMRGEL